VRSGSFPEQAHQFGNGNDYGVESHQRYPSESSMLDPDGDDMDSVLYAWFTHSSRDALRLEVYNNGGRNLDVDTMILGWG
jgi:hypothetical protein